MIGFSLGSERSHVHLKIEGHVCFRHQVVDLGDLWALAKAHIGCWVLNWSQVEAYPEPAWVPIDVGEAVHVIPIDDEVQHVCLASCVCGPVLDDSEARPLYTHASLDGREVRTT